MTLRELYDTYLTGRGISTDSRTAKRGQIYVALTGPNHDGNDYAREALEKGVKLAIVSKSPYNRKSKRVLVVKDPLAILQKLAQYHRRNLSAKVFALTGSNGKTTTRALIVALLSRKLKVHGTEGNLNNHIGLPLSILSAQESDEILVLEMGANHVGEIAKLAEIAEPDYGLITNIGKAHLQGFGGIEGVKRGKSELYQALGKSDGIAFVNGKGEHLLQLSTVVFNKVFYNQRLDVEYSALRTHLDDVRLTDHGLAFVMKTRTTEYPVQTALQGLYNINNVCAAVTVAEYFNVEMEDIVSVLESFEMPANRSQEIVREGIRFTADAYNANPTSVSAALDSWNKKPGKKKHIILGAMKELGAASSEEHLAMATLAKKIRGAQVHLVGAEYAVAAQQLGLTHYSTTDDIIKDIKSILETGDQVLLKGSRAMRLEDIIDQYEAPAEDLEDSTT